MAPTKNAISNTPSASPHIYTKKRKKKQIFSGKILQNILLLQYPCTQQEHSINSVILALLSYLLSQPLAIYTATVFFRVKIDKIKYLFMRIFWTWWIISEFSKSPYYKGDKNQTKLFFLFVLCEMVGGGCVNCEYENAENLFRWNSILGWIINGGRQAGWKYMTT